MKIPILISAAYILMIPDTANAYIEPGTGSYIFQIILGVVLGSLVFIKNFWVKLKYRIKTAIDYFKRKNLKKK